MNYIIYFIFLAHEDSFNDLPQPSPTGISVKSSSSEHSSVENENGFIKLFYDTLVLIGIFLVLFKITFSMF